MSKSQSETDANVNWLMLANAVTFQNDQMIKQVK